MYNSKVIEEEFDELRGVNQLNPNVTNANYFAYRIFSDEAIASASAAAYTNALRGDPNTLLVLISGIGRSTFGYGVPKRLSDLVSAQLKRDYTFQTVALNPTAKDSHSYTRPLQLSIAYGNEQLAVSYPFANYVRFSNSPPVNLLQRYLNPK